MSTAQDVISLVNHNVNPDANTFRILNQAIRSVARRLYFLKSNIIISDLSVSIWAEVTATGTDIAFVDSDPDTITSVSTDLSEFTAGQHITTDDSSNPGPFEIDTVATNTLTLVSTDELTAVAAGDSVTITSNDEYGDLPSDFWGLVGYPYLSGKPWRLKPLPNLTTKLSYTGAGIPLYYAIKGQDIYVTPDTSADYTIKGDYFAKPTQITATTDTMPYWEMFDDVIAERMRVFYTKDPGSVEIGFKYLQDEIDLIAMKYAKKAPYNLSGGVDW
jgi:hypothetical protein